jgi:F0F1-type ATP synthase assembly protein I
MVTRAKVKKRLGYVSEAGGRLLVFTPETIRWVVSHIQKKEYPHSTGEAKGRVGTFPPETLIDRVMNVIDKEKTSFGHNILQYPRVLGLAGVSLFIWVLVVPMALGGLLLDGKLGTTPLFVVVFLILGIIAGFGAYRKALPLIRGRRDKGDG